MSKKLFLFCFLAMSFYLKAHSEFEQILNRFKGAQISFLAVSSKTHQVIAEQNANLLLNPASNIKLVTTLAALEILHPEYRFKTEYWAMGPIKSGILQGDLVVKGFGDPSITSERLQKVARQIKLLGIHSIAGSVVLDESYFGGETVAKGWESEVHSQKLYSAPISALALNHNTAIFLFKPGEVGEAAIFSPDPPADYFKVTGEIRTLGHGGRPKIAVSESDQNMRVSLKGSVSSFMPFSQLKKRVNHPARYFASVFNYFLKQEGITIGGRPVALGTPKIILTDRSPILSQIIAETNKTSSNFIAEMLVKAIAGEVSSPAKFETGLAEIRKFLEQKVGLKKNSFVLANGSGLGPYNRFSARQFVMLLEYGSRNFEVCSEFVSSLGVAGTQGTLSKRMRQEPTLRSLRAKTGTLNGVSSLSGYVDTQGDDTVMFSVLVQGKGRVISKARGLEDRIGNWLARLHTESAVPLLAEDSEEVEDEEWEEVSGG
jgi:D-alanyl-D-alanine carboxypeptidase/D-alanyl-D-alanine-endopeptidase (penicillin-binding protein 4)